MFALNPSTAFGHLFDSKKHKDQINQLKETINSIELELKKKNRARNMLYKLLEEDETNLAELKDRLQINKDEILDLEGNLNETKLRYQDLVSMTERERDIKNFLRNNKDLLRKIRKDIFNLNFKDRKLLVESMLRNKISVDYQEDNELDGPGGASCEYKLEWNPDMLQRFISEGKITNLDQNSRNNPCGDRFWNNGNRFQTTLPGSFLRTFPVLKRNTHYSLSRTQIELNAFPIRIFR